MQQRALSSGEESEKQKLHTKYEVHLEEKRREKHKQEFWYVLNKLALTRQVSLAIARGHLLPRCVDP